MTAPQHTERRCLRSVLGQSESLLVPCVAEGVHAQTANLRLAGPTPCKE